MSDHFSLQRSLEDARSYATELLTEYGLNSPPINPTVIADRLGIIIRESDGDDRYEGCLLRFGGKAAICLNRQINSIARKNFTIAHEIGHFLIPGHSRETRCLKDGFEYSRQKEEMQANAFASELLMPKGLVLPLVQSRDISLNVIKEISDTFATSLTASAIRYAQLSNYYCFVSVSLNNEIQYSVPSDDLRDSTQYKYEQLSHLSKDSLAYSYFETEPSSVKTSSIREEVLTSAWFPNLDSGRVICFEECMGLRRGEVLSLVWVQDKPSYGDDDDEYSDDE